MPQELLDRVAFAPEDLYTVARVLHSLKCAKSSAAGTDGFTGNMARALAGELAPILLRLFSKAPIGISEPIQ